MDVTRQHSSGYAHSMSCSNSELGHVLPENVSRSSFMQKMLNKKSLFI